MNCILSSANEVTLRRHHNRDWAGACSQFGYTTGRWDNVPNLLCATCQCGLVSLRGGGAAAELGPVTHL